MRRLWIIALLLAAAPSATAQAQDQVTICHATGSAENPYVQMTLDSTAMLEHINHEDDLVPAPAEGCPATAVVDPEDTPVPTATPTPAVATPAPTPAPTRTPRPRRPRNDRKRDRDRDDRRDRDRDDGAVRGQQESGGGSGGTAPMLTAAPQPAQASATGTQDLPMTGAEIWLIGAFGIGFLLSGSGLRLLSPAAGRPPGPSGR